MKLFCWKLRLPDGKVNVNKGEGRCWRRVTYLLHQKSHATEASPCPAEFSECTPFPSWAYPNKDAASEDLAAYHGVQLQAMGSSMSKGSGRYCTTFLSKRHLERPK